MLIKKIMALVAICATFAGCATENAMVPGTNKPMTTTEKGVQYLLGRGVPVDNAKAFSYFKEAADDGDVFAQNEVAYMYAAGKGTSRDDEAAFSYYQQAANHGLASAQYSLATMYLNGLGTLPNKALAMQWLQKSAAHGFEPAKIALKKNS